jgi:hypothetical protein
MAEIEIGVFLKLRATAAHRHIGGRSAAWERSAQNSVEGTVEKKSAASAIGTRTGALIRPRLGRR